MMNQTTRTIHGYLGELNDCLRDLPRGRREEITGDIRAHIDAALDEAGEQSPAVIASILDQLGAPEEIAAAARVDSPPQRTRVCALDIVTIVLLLVGGVVLPFVGWILGVLMLWASNTWRTKDKVVATLLIPGGLFASFVAGFISAHRLSGGPGAGTWTLLTLVLILTIGGPLFTTVWLTRHAHRVV